MLPLFWCDAGCFGRREMVFGLYSAENRIGIQKEAEGTVIERKWAGERQLPAGKVTILTPSPRTGETQGPLMLSVGPSLTMALPMIVMAFAGSRMMSQGSNFLSAVDAHRTVQCGTGGFLGAV